MKTAYALGGLLLLASTCAFAQDPQMRAEAIEILERAQRVSSLPSGPISSAWIPSGCWMPQPVRKRAVSPGWLCRERPREEFKFGSFHAINVFTSRGLATVRTGEVIPPSLVDLLRLTPSLGIRFDHDDVISAITNSGANGSAGALY